MTTAALVLAAVLAIGAVLFVARPFLRAPGREERATPPGEAELERLALVEERDRALAALKELEFDHRTGKVSDDDYAALLGPLRQEAARALLAVDAHAAADGGPAALSGEGVPEPAAAPDATGVAGEASGDAAPLADPGDAVAGRPPREP